MVAQAAATAEAALKTDLHGDLKKALANVKPKVTVINSGFHAPCGFASSRLFCQAVFQNWLACTMCLSSSAWLTSLQC